MEMQVVAVLQGFDSKLSSERCYDALQQVRLGTHAPVLQLSAYPYRAPPKLSTA